MFYCIRIFSTTTMRRPTKNKIVNNFLFIPLYDIQQPTQHGLKMKIIIIVLQAIWFLYSYNRFILFEYNVPTVRYIEIINYYMRV